MKEGDALSFCADSRGVVDQSNASCATACKSGIDVVDSKTDVVDSRTAFLNEFRDW